MAALPFKILGVDHIGLAPKDPQRTHDFFAKVLNLPALGQELVASQQTNTDIFSSQHQSASSDTRLEILIDQGGGPIAKFLEKKGSGIHHVALRVDNVDLALRYLATQGIRLIDEKPRLGAHRTMIGFVHPEATGGLLVELVQCHES